MNTPIRLSAFVPTTPRPPADEEDPHLAGQVAQDRYIAQCNSQGVAPTASGMEEAYWSAYRTTSQWGEL